MKSRGKKIMLFILIALIFSYVFLGLNVHASTQQENIITTRADFINAVSDAKNKDTILVGDIDFNFDHTGAVNEAEKIIIDKNILIKNGKAEGNALFTGASFILNGTKNAISTTNFKFEGITFDEKLDTTALTNEDWELSYDSLGETIGNYPLKNQYAIECRGNAEANFDDCEFKNYMHTYGPAIRAFYADYTLIPSVEAEHGDNVPYKLTINLDNCDFISNASLYAGGAIHIEAADKNVTLNAKNCNFENNKSGFVSYALGGGAVFLKNAEASFIGCNFKNNDANYYYGGEKNYVDTLIGGAIGCSNKTSLTVRNCNITENKSSNGGGISAEESYLNIESCYIANNKAIPSTDEKKYNGIASQCGLGGAIYLNCPKKVVIANSEIMNNYAENVFGAIFTDYNPLLEYGDYSVELLFCTIANNICGTKMSEYYGYGEKKWEWFSYPTDFFDITYLTCYGNLVVDEVYEKDIVRHEEAIKENGYNYYSYSVPKEWNIETGKLTNSPEIPTEFIKEKLSNRNLYGTFTIGANNHDVNYTFMIGDEFFESKLLPAGVMPTMPVIEKEGYTLSPWTIKADFEFNEDVYFIVGNKTKDVEFTANFIPNKYTATFNFGNYQWIEVEQTYGEAILFPEIIEKEGYKFDGWYTDSTDGVKINEGDLFETPNDITYYALYAKKFSTTNGIVLSIGLVLIASIIVLTIIVLKQRRQILLISTNNDTTVEKTEPDISMLSAREKEVLNLLLEGKKRNEIAAILCISENTVKKQMSSIYSKLNISSRSELFALFK